MTTLDMHIHSRHSADGQFSPRELIRMAVESGLRVLALTDHNTAQGCLEMARLAREAKLGFISGIELDCRFQGVWLHVLGYGIDPLFKGFIDLENEIIRQERLNAEAKLNAFENMGFQVDRDKIRQRSFKGIIWGEMIGEVLLADPRNLAEPALAPYRPGGGRADNPLVNFDWDFCSPGQAAHFRVEYISLPEAVDLIGQAGGRAALAHPGRDLKEDSGLLTRIAAQGLWGLEAYSSYHSPGQTDFYAAWGRKLGLVLTCGSDFHGRTKPAVKLGAAGSPDEKGLLSSLAEWGLAPLDF